jgi:hypothetical protein
MIVLVALQQAFPADLLLALCLLLVHGCHTHTHIKPLRHTELERLRVEVHGFHLELAALQAQLSDKDALLQRALGDASQLDSERAAIAARAEDATQAALSLERQLREAQQSLQEAQKARAELTEKLAAVEARAEGLQGDQARWLRAERGLRAQLQELQEQLDEAQQQRGQLQQQAKEAAQREADASRCVCRPASRYVCRPSFVPEVCKHACVGGALGCAILELMCAPTSTFARKQQQPLICVYVRSSSSPD